MQLMRLCVSFRRIGLACATLVGVACAGATGGPPSLGSELRITPVVRAVQQARPSVVNIHGRKTVRAATPALNSREEFKQVNGMGTGVVIDPRGYVVTNYHVVEGVGRIQVTLDDGRTYVARLVSNDPKTDLAVIHVPIEGELPVIHIGSSDDLMPGEPVVAVGNAYGYEHTVTRGIISALHRTVQVSDEQKYYDLIQTDASINPGNSGGPLLNIDGEMIGINVAVRVGAQGIGFAIPVNEAMAIAAKLMSVEQVDRNWHGIEAQMRNSESSIKAVVNVIQPESPAARSGLRSGDVVTNVGGTAVVWPLDIERALLGRQPGEEVDLTVERDGKPVKLNLTLARAPGASTDVGDKSWDLVGVRVEPMPSTEFAQLRTRYRGGLRVTEVRPKSPAATQGIRPGDVLVGMHHWETISLENLAYILSVPDFEQLQPIKFYIVRNSETLYGHLRVATKR